MNAAVLLMTSAWMAGADAAPPAVIPAPAPAAGAMMMAPPITHPYAGGCNTCGNGCGAGCSGAYDECPDSGGRPSLFGKLRAKFGGNGGCKSCGPAHTGFTTSSYDACGCGKGGGGLFSRLKHKGSGDGGCCDPCGSANGHAVYGAPAGCALPQAPGGAVMPYHHGVQPAPMPMTPTPVPVPAPAPIPQKGEDKGTTPKKTTQLAVPPVATPVSNPKTVTPPLGGSGSPF